jgi:hypothetical protein
MPFKSKAQRRKFAQLLVDGKISNQTFEEWNRETGAKKLPERVVPGTPAGKKLKRNAPEAKAKSAVDDGHLASEATDTHRLRIMIP